MEELNHTLRQRESLVHYKSFNILCGSVSDQDWTQIRSGLSIRIRIRIREGKNDPQKKKKV